MRIPESAIDYCVNQSRQNNSTFHPAFWFLPEVQRKALHVLYYFCRLVDDAVDEAPGEQEARRRLVHLERGLSGDCPGKLWEAFGWVLKRFEIPPEYSADLIKGAKTDIGAVRLQTLEELDEYCYRVAGTVGLMTLYIFEAPVESIKDSALSLARAYQYTNIIRDVDEDRQLDRCYIPRRLLKEAGAIEHWKNRENFLELKTVLKKLALRAKTEYLRGVKVFGYVSWRQRLTLALMTSAYSGYLNSIEKSGFDVWNYRPKYSKLDLPLLLFKTVQGTVFSPRKCLLTF
jgi:phytoene synthase